MSNDTEVKVRGSFINRYADELTTSINSSMSTYCKPIEVNYVMISPNNLLVITYDKTRTKLGDYIHIKRLHSIRDVIMHPLLDDVIYNCIFEVIKTVTINGSNFYNISLNNVKQGYEDKNVSSLRDTFDCFYDIIDKMKKYELLIHIEAPIKIIAKSYHTDRSSLSMNPLTPDQVYDYNKNDRIITITKIPTIIPDMSIKSYDSIILLKRYKIFNLELIFKKDEKNIRTKSFRLFKRRR